MLDAWYPGESNGTALGAVLFGKVDPGGHLPVTFPQSLSQVPASSPSQFPGVNGQVDYSEGIDVGYRYYDANSETPLFPFGYGLSYTTFKFSNLKITPPIGAELQLGPRCHELRLQRAVELLRRPSQRPSPTRARSPAQTSRSCTSATPAWPENRRDS